MALISGWFDHCAIVEIGKKYRAVNSDNIFPGGKYFGKPYVGVERNSRYVTGCERFITDSVTPALRGLPNGLNLEGISEALATTFKTFKTEVHGPKNPMHIPFY